MRRRRVVSNRNKTPAISHAIVLFVLNCCIIIFRMRLFRFQSSCLFHSGANTSFFNLTRPPAYNRYSTIRMSERLATRCHARNTLHAANRYSNQCAITIVLLISSATHYSRSGPPVPSEHRTRISRSPPRPRRICLTRHVLPHFTQHLSPSRTSCPSV